MTLTPTLLGFATTAEGWQRAVGGRLLTFRLLEQWADLVAVEELQRSVFGVSDRDLIAASILIGIPKTGGQILGAFDPPTGQLVGFATSYGGYVASRPRLLSDMLAVTPSFRGGLGFALKSLQAALACAAGFQEIAWTVDPLRAANARLNFERLGATACEYEENLYGNEFAQGLYGGLPTDRLVMRWELTTPVVQQRLCGQMAARPVGALDGLPVFTSPGPAQARLPIPNDIDHLVVSDFPAALAARLQLRAGLQLAFGANYAITGFAGSTRYSSGQLLLEQRTAATTKES